MSRIQYGGSWYDVRPGETALDALLRHGQNPKFSCRRGSCGVCAQRCVRGRAPEAAQQGLRASLRRAGYVLPCKLVPVEDLELAPAREADLFVPAIVRRKELLAPRVCRLVLEPFTSFEYRAGQFVRLRRADGLSRSYSLASAPGDDAWLELHVARVAGGAMSSWIFDELGVDDELELQGPNGRFSYPPDCLDQDLLLVGSGTGLAPLLGILRDALAAGHRGRIVVYHGSRAPDGLYAHVLLTQLAAVHPQLSYRPCISGEATAPGAGRGRAHHVAARRHDDLSGWQVFAAGHPGMVAEVQTWAAGAGAHPTEIHADPHGPAVDPVSPSAPPGVPGPAPGMWEALGEGRVLLAVLTDFYGDVFADPVLGPYFHAVSKERVIGQVYGFMRDWLTGERRYFGLQPRAAHHWMVISDEIFDRRARLMDECLRRHGVAEAFVRRWHRFEESFRAEVVKATPEKLIVGGVEMPLEGFGEDELSVGTVCDGCRRGVEAGERVRYHLRLGLTYCTGCSTSGLGC